MKLKKRSNKDRKLYLLNELRKSITNLQAQIEFLIYDFEENERNNEVEDKIKAITDPEEIKKVEKEVDKLKQKCMIPKFELNEAEMKKLEEFKKAHGPGICSAMKYSTGECFTFQFLPSWIGTSKKVICSCGAERDITDLGDDI